MLSRDCLLDVFVFCDCRVVMEGGDGSCNKVKIMVFASCWVINRTGIDLIIATTKTVRISYIVSLRGDGDYDWASP